MPKPSPGFELALARVDRWRARRRYVLELSERMSMTAAQLEWTMSFAELYDRMDLDRVHAEEHEAARGRAR